MAWWSNYSGTYQPIAAFLAQTGLPEDKFVPWQKLQLSGTAMQRGTFSERRAVGPTVPPAAERGRPDGKPRASELAGPARKADAAGSQACSLVAAVGSKGGGS